LELIKHTLPNDHKIYLFSDLHIGSVLCYEKGLIKMIDQIKKEKNSYCIIGGDLAEAIVVDDPRFSINSIKRKYFTPLDQYNYITDLLEPIKDKILGILWGNHDIKISKYGNFVKDIVCKRLNVPYAGFTSKFIITTGKAKNKKQIKIFYSHGFGSVNSTNPDPITQIAAMKKSVKTKLRSKAGDCEIMCMGHSHKLLVAEPTSKLVLVDDGKEIKQMYTTDYNHGSLIPEDHRYYVNSGSFYKLYEIGVDGYASQAGYDPTEMGYAVVNVKSGVIESVDKIVI